MNTHRIIRLSSKGFILLSATSLLSVRAMAFVSPQSVMDLVGVNLPNTDAFSSIRGVYGGVGLTLFVSLLYCFFRNVQQGLAFLSLLWGSYALSRAITILAEGPLGDFGTQWIITETVLFVLAIILLLLNKKESSRI
jgi:hypothetical protein